MIEHLFISLWVLILSIIIILFFVRSNTYLTWFSILLFLITAMGIVTAFLMAEKAPKSFSESRYVHALTENKQKGAITIGKVEGSDIRLFNNAVEGLQAKITYTGIGENRHYYIRNIGIRRVEVNGWPTNSALLKTGNRFGINTEKFTVEKIGFTSVTILNTDSNERILVTHRDFIKKIQVTAYRIASFIPIVCYLTSAYEKQVGELRTQRGDAIFYLKGKDLTISGKTPEDALDIFIMDEYNKPLFLSDRTSIIRNGDRVTIGQTHYQFSYDSTSITLKATKRRSALSFVFDQYGNGLIPLPGDEPLSLMVKKEGRGIVIHADDSRTSFTRENGVFTIAHDKKPGVKQEGGVIHAGDIIKINRGKGSSIDLEYTSYGERHLVLLALLLVVFLLISVLLVRLGHIHEANFQFLAVIFLLLVVGLITRMSLGLLTEQVRLQEMLLPLGKSIYEICIVACIIFISFFHFSVVSRLRDSSSRAGKFLSKIGFIKWLPVLLLTFQLPRGEQGIALRGLAFQPVELAKSLMVVYLAYTSWEVVKIRGLDQPFGLKKRPDNWIRRVFGKEYGLFRYCFAGFIILFLLGFVNDLSPFAILAIFITSTYLFTFDKGTRELVVLCALTIFVISSLWVDIITSERSIADRFRTWTDLYSSNSGGQFITSLWTIENGGLYGQGLTNSNGFINVFAIQNDLIISFFMNRMGYMGFILLLSTYVLMMIAGIKAYVNTCKDLHRQSDEKNTRQLMILFSLVMFGIQIVLPFCSVGGLLPVMGQSLPFLSAGNSQLIFLSLYLTGLVIFASRKNLNGVTNGN